MGVRRPFYTFYSSAIAAMAVLFLCSPCRAGSTDPELAVGEVTAIPAGDTAVLQVSGTWAFDDILQVDFPLNLVVSQGTTFVRYQVGQPARSGNLPGLADGFQVGEIGALEAQGVEDPGARFVLLSAHRIVVVLPPSISDGPLTVTGYVVVPGADAVLSNSVTTTLSGVGGAP